MTRNDLRDILLFTAGLVILGRIMATIYDNNDDLRGRPGKPLYARDNLWREGRPQSQPPTIKWNARVDGLLYDDQGDMVFRFRGQYYVASMSFFSDVPLDSPPVPESALTAEGGKG